MHFKTVGGMDAAVELTRMYLQRVLKCEPGVDNLVTATFLAELQY
jgi:hypothetical protein